MWEIDGNDMGKSGNDGINVGILWEMIRLDGEIIENVLDE